MPPTSDTALLILDFEVGIGDQPYAKNSAQRAAAALNAGRAAGLPVVFSKVKFRAEYRDIADSNKAFATHQDEEPVPTRCEQACVLRPGDQSRQTHEALGHGLATLITGGKIIALTTCYLNSAGGSERWIPAGGGLAVHVRDYE